MSHFDWDVLRESLDQVRRGEGRVLRTMDEAIRITVTHTKGYILALEDVLKDLEDLTLDLTPPCDLLVTRTHATIREKVTGSLTEAQTTLAALLELQEETT